MAEVAITMPIVVLVILFAMNISGASYTAIAAAAAANYGARIGAVSKLNTQVWAQGAAWNSLVQSKVWRNIEGVTVQVDPAPDGVVVVNVAWSYPSILHGLCSYFGDGCPREFFGTARSAWKKEGW